MLRRWDSLPSTTTWIWTGWARRTNARAPTVPPVWTGKRPTTIGCPCGTTWSRFWTGPSLAPTGLRRCVGCASRKGRGPKPAPWGFRCLVHTALLTRSFGDGVLAGCQALPSVTVGLPSRHPPTSIPRDVHFDDRFFQRRCIGLRSRSTTSGVSRTHHGPCGVAWMPSRRPDLHQSAMVDTVTFRA